MKARSIHVHHRKKEREADLKERERLYKLLSDSLKTLSKGIEAIANQMKTFAKSNAKSTAERKPATEKTPPKAPPAKKTAEKPAAKKTPANKPAPKTAAKKPAKKTATKRKKAPAKGKGAGAAPSTEVILAIIEKSSEPVDAGKIRAETGFEARKVSNAVYRLKKRGKIKTVDRGKYVAAKGKEQ